jgi:hypothetical protein
MKLMEKKILHLSHSLQVFIVERKETFKLLMNHNTGGTVMATRKKGSLHSFQRVFYSLYSYRMASKKCQATYVPQSFSKGVEQIFK